MFIVDEHFLKKRNYQSLEAVFKEIQPEYVVIANETSKHYSTLKTVLSFEVPQVLVEKPLFIFNCRFLRQP